MHITKHHVSWTVALLILMLLTGIIVAQDKQPANPGNTNPEVTPEATPDELIGPIPDVIEVEATDGRMLVANYYVPPGLEFAPVALLLHELYTTGTSWGPLVGPLLANGYRVVAVDLRGHGRTRGAIDWYQAQEDTLTWLEWIYAQPGTQLNAVFTVGSSMGSNLALVGCAAAEHCAGTVAIGPGLHYFGVYTEQAILTGKPALLIYAEGDYYPARDVPKMLALAEENGLASLTALVYEGRRHGVQLFTEEDSIQEIITWMNLHRP